MTTEVADLMGLAQQLSAGSSECEWRAGASRAYYAAYHKALGFADSYLPKNHENAGVHEQLTKRLSKAGSKGKALAYVLIDLKKVRTHADYHLITPFTQHDATDLVANCVAFMPRVDAFRAHQESSQAATS